MCCERGELEDCFGGEVEKRRCSGFSWGTVADKALNFGLKNTRRVQGKTSSSPTAPPSAAPSCCNVFFGTLSVWIEDLVQNTAHAEAAAGGG